MVRIGIMAGRNVLWETGVLGVMVLGVSACAADLRVFLNGEWEACAGPLNDDYTAMISRERTWQPVTVPARKWPTDELNQAAAVWARRTMVLPDHLAGYDGVLHWGRVHWGAKSWVNGVAVGESPVTCPYEVLLPAGLLHPGANLVVLQRTWAAASMSAAKTQRSKAAGFISNAIHSWCLCTLRTIRASSITARRGGPIGEGLSGGVRGAGQGPGGLPNVLSVPAGTLAPAADVERH